MKIRPELKSSAELRDLQAGWLPPADRRAVEEELTRRESTAPAAAPDDAAQEKLF